LKTKKVLINYYLLDVACTIRGACNATDTKSKLVISLINFWVK